MLSGMESTVAYSCSQCGRTESDPDASVTMFAQRNGWALTRRFADNKLLLEWFCPTCRARRSSTSIATAKKA